MIRTWAIRSPAPRFIKERTAQAAAAAAAAASHSNHFTARALSFPCSVRWGRWRRRACPALPGVPLSCPAAQLHGAETSRASTVRQGQRIRCGPTCAIENTWTAAKLRTGISNRALPLQPSLPLIWATVSDVCTSALRCASPASTPHSPHVWVSIGDWSFQCMQLHALAGLFTLEKPQSLGFNS